MLARRGGCCDGCRGRPPHLCRSRIPHEQHRNGSSHRGRPVFVTFMKTSLRPTSSMSYCMSRGELLSPLVGRLTATARAVRRESTALLRPKRLHQIGIGTKSRGNPKRPPLWGPCPVSKQLEFRQTSFPLNGHARYSHHNASQHHSAKLLIRRTIRVRASSKALSAESALVTSHHFAQATPTNCTQTAACQQLLPKFVVVVHREHAGVSDKRVRQIGRGSSRPRRANRILRRVQRTGPPAWFTKRKPDRRHTWQAPENRRCLGCFYLSLGESLQGLRLCARNESPHQAGVIGIARSHHFTNDREFQSVKGKRFQITDRLKAGADHDGKLTLRLPIFESRPPPIGVFQNGNLLNANSKSSDQSGYRPDAHQLSVKPFCWTDGPYVDGEYQTHQSRIDATLCLPAGLTPQSHHPGSEGHD